jgi:nucleotide-binding universal stress UspA family protein
MEVGVHVLIRIGYVAEWIAELANSLGVALIVLTSHGKGGWDRLWIGSVADQLLRVSTLPVLLLRPTESPEGVFPDGYPRRVLIPLDGTPEAEVILGPLRELCAPGSTHLELVSVLPEPLPLPPPDLTGELVAALQSEEGLDAHLREVASRMRKAGFGAIRHRVVRRHSVARGLLEVIEGEGIDLLALSMHVRRRLDRMILGSVFDKMIRAAETPVLTLRSPGSK